MDMSSPGGKISAAADVGDVVGFQVASLRRMSASKSIKRGVSSSMMPTGS
jgi:hypothetical protein